MVGSINKKFKIYYFIIPGCLRIQEFEAYSYSKSKIEFAKKIGINKKQIIKSILNNKSIL